MSGAVSEEDVLAVLLLWACRPIVTNAYSTQQMEDRWAYDAAAAIALIGTTPGAIIARERIDALKSIEEAIADSERRWDVEMAEREVLAEAERWALQTLRARPRDDAGLMAAVMRMEATRVPHWRGKR